MIDFQKKCLKGSQIKAIRSLNCIAEAQSHHKVKPAAPKYLNTWRLLGLPREGMQAVPSPTPVASLCSSAPASLYPLLNWFITHADKAKGQSSKSK